MQIYLFVSSILWKWLVLLCKSRYLLYMPHNFDWLPCILLNIWCIIQYLGYIHGSMCHRIHRIFLNNKIITIEVQTIFTLLAHVGILAECTIIKTGITNTSRWQIVSRLTTSTHWWTRTCQAWLITSDTATRQYWIVSITNLTICTI